MNETYKVDLRPAVALDLYKLPPMMVITQCPIAWTLAQGTSRKHRKYLAAQIILGQPFNNKRS